MIIMIDILSLNCPSILPKACPACEYGLGLSLRLLLSVVLN